MGRRESELNPQDSPLEQFAHELRELRRKAGSLSYRELSRIAHYSASALSTAANGRTLPSLPVLEAYVRACGGNEDEWRERWHALAESPVADQLAHDEKDAGNEAVDGGIGAAAPETRPLPAPDRPRTPYQWPPRRRMVLIGVPVLLAMTAATTVSVVALVGGAYDAPAAAVTPVDTYAPGTACANKKDVSGFLLPEPPGLELGPTTEMPGDMNFSAATTAHHHWMWWWGSTSGLTETVTSDKTYQGWNTLRVQEAPGFTAIGTTAMTGLDARDTVTVHLWYGGQGQLTLCPFVQASGSYLDYWPEIRELDLDPNSSPGWRTYQWKIPDMNVKGTGIQVDNIGATDAVFYIGDITW